MQIDKNSRIPAYVQMMDFVLEKIESGALSEGAKLPSERELCTIHAVSRATVRQAIQALEQDGHVNTFKGRGTYVAAKRLNQKMSGLYSFTETMKDLDKTISTRLISFEQMPCDERIARKMQCDVGMEIFCFTRVRYIDDEPMLIVTTHLPSRRFVGLNADVLVQGSLYTAMVDVYKVTFNRVHETLQSVRARSGEDKLLQIKPGAPCMKIDRYSYEKDALIEYAVGIARGDKFEYKVELC